MRWWSEGELSVWRNVLDHPLIGIVRDAAGGRRRSCEGRGIRDVKRWRVWGGGMKRRGRNRWQRCGGGERGSRWRRRRRIKKSERITPTRGTAGTSQGRSGSHGHPQGRGAHTTIRQYNSRQNHDCTPSLLSLSCTLSVTFTQRPKPRAQKGIENGHQRRNKGAQQTCDARTNYKKKRPSRAIDDRRQSRQSAGIKSQTNRRVQGGDTSSNANSKTSAGKRGDQTGLKTEKKGYQQGIAFKSVNTEAANKAIEIEQREADIERSHTQTGKGWWEREREWAGLYSSIYIHMPSTVKTCKGCLSSYPWSIPCNPFTNWLKCCRKRPITKYGNKAAKWIYEMIK